MLTEQEIREYLALCEKATPGPWRVCRAYNDYNYERTGNRFTQRNTETTIRPVERRLDRVAYRMANRVDRLKAIGNGQVPAVVAAAWEILNGLD